MSGFLSIRLRECSLDDPSSRIRREAADRIDALEYELAQTVAEADGCWTMCGEHARRIESLARENARLRAALERIKNLGQRGTHDTADDVMIQCYRISCATLAEGKP